jgi:hypothetical protein
MTLNPKLHMPLALAAFGLVFFTVGIYAVLDASWKQTDLAGRLRAAPVVDGASISAQPVGALVLIEGSVGAANPVIESGLVTLLRQEAEAVSTPGDSRRRISWKTLRAEARPLQVETAAGTLFIVNDDYAWRDAPRRVPDNTGVVTPGLSRVAGFAVGDPIVAYGTIVTRDGTPGIKAAEIHGGSRAGYLIGKQATDWVGYILGGAFALVGAVTLAVSAFNLRAIARSQ